MVRPPNETRSVTIRPVTESDTSGAPKLHMRFNAPREKRRETRRNTEKKEKEINAQLMLAVLPVSRYVDDLRGK